LNFIIQNNPFISTLPFSEGLRLQGCTAMWNYHSTRSNIPEGCISTPPMWQPQISQPREYYAYDHCDFVAFTWESNARRRQYTVEICLHTLNTKLLPELHTNIIPDTKSGPFRSFSE